MQVGKKQTSIKNQGHQKTLNYQNEKGEEDTEAHALGVLAGEGETDAVPQLEVVKEGLGVVDSEGETLGEIVLVAQLLPE